MDFMHKYPRTRHIEGSRKQAGDEDLDYISFQEIAGYYVVVEEKVDGANSGISFDTEGNLLLQSRGHFLNGGYGERQFDLLKLWASCHRAELYDILGRRYVMYGEWLYAKHTEFYDALTNYFMEFDILDKTTGEFLSTARRRELLQDYPFISQVLVLFEGKIQSLEELTALVGRSHFKTEHYLDALKEQCRKLGLEPELVMQQTDCSDQMEGIYIKVEGAPGEKRAGNTVLGRCKYVRSTFLNTILDSGTHWLNRPMVPNLLQDGVDLFSADGGSCGKETEPWN